MVDVVDALRRFNRSYTQRIGVLDDRFMGLDRPLGPSRLLWEIGPEGRPVTELRDALGLDSGYLSRLLRRLEGEGLLAVAPDGTDRRRRIASLTPDGAREWEELDRRSDDLALGLVASLSEQQQGELAAALASADRLLRAATVRFGPVDPAGPAAVAALSAYFAELDDRFPEGFDPGDTVVADADGFRPPTGVFLLATSDGATVACGAVTAIGPGVAEIKRMWVATDWRGLGLGRRMLAELEAHAASLGHTTVRLDTNSALTEAITMYENAGYASIERYNDNPFAKRWFEKPLT